MTFEEFQPGLRLVYGPATVSEAQIVAFAREYDPQWFHADVARARIDHQRLLELPATR